MSWYVISNIRLGVADDADMVLVSTSTCCSEVEAYSTDTVSFVGMYPEATSSNCSR